VAELAEVEEKTKIVFQAMGGNVFKLPEESNDQTQYSNTIDKLNEHIKTAYKETYMEIASLFNDPMTQPTARRPAPLRKDAKLIS